MASTSTAPALTGSQSRVRRFLRGLGRDDRRSLVGMLSFILLLRLVGFGVLFGLVVPERYQLGGATPVFGVGVGLLAYTFGLRHAFDAEAVD